MRRLPVRGLSGLLLALVAVFTPASASGQLLFDHAPADTPFDDTIRPTWIPRPFMENRQTAVPELSLAAFPTLVAPVNGQANIGLQHSPVAAFANPTFAATGIDLLCAPPHQQVPVAHSFMTGNPPTPAFRSLLEQSLFAVTEPESPLPDLPADPGSPKIEGSDRPFVIRAQNGSPLGSAGRLRFDYGEDSGDDARIRGQLMLGLGAVFALDAEATWLDHTTNNRFTEPLWLGDANLVYRLDVDRINLRFGGGANYRILDGDTDVGYNLTYATDFYISRPWLISGEVDWGELGGDDLFHWRVTGGYALGALEIFAGYDSREVGRWRFNGPVAGLGLSF